MQLLQSCMARHNFLFCGGGKCFPIISCKQLKNIASTLQLVTQQDSSKSSPTDICSADTETGSDTEHLQINMQKTLYYVFSTASL